jgi:hypothetical protein
MRDDVFNAEGLGRAQSHIARPRYFCIMTTIKSQASDYNFELKQKTGEANQEIFKPHRKEWLLTRISASRFLNRKS